MKNLDLFKSYIIDLLKIGKWEPTPLQLEEIARRVDLTENQTVEAIDKIVREVCPPVNYKATEGVDNSDIRALLALALAAAKK